MYFIIFILFVFFIVFTWNSTKELETPIMRISFLVVGTLFITIITLIIFQISKIGVNYPKEEMIGQVRRIVLLIFIPINGLITLTQCASIFSQIKSRILPKKKMEKRIKILAIIFIIIILFECFYFKDIQNGIIKLINAK